MPSSTYDAKLHIVSRLSVRLSVCPAPTLTQPWKNATFKLQGKQYVMLTTGAAYLTVCHADAYD